jgi:hypothetical protein
MDPVRLHGYPAEATFTFPIPSSWQPVADGHFTLHYQAGAIENDKAVLTHRLNNHIIGTTSLPSQAGQLKLALPVAYLQPGTNVLELSVLMPLEDDARCLMPDHPQRWMELASESMLVLQLAPKEEALSLAAFPQQFETLNQDDPVIFVVPTQPDGHELTALSAIAYSLAAKSTPTTHWRVETADRFEPEKVDGPVVLIGTAERNPHVRLFPPSGARGMGWVTLARPTWSKAFPVLVVSGPNGKSVSEAAQALAHPAVRKEVHGPTLLLSEAILPSPAEPRTSFTLGELGYEEEVAQGSGRQVLTYPFALPLGMSLHTGEIDLHFAHSRGLYAETSSLSVFLNDTLVGTVPIEGAESTARNVRFPIDDDLFRPGRNVLQFAFDFTIPEDRCALIGPDGFWGSVRPETHVALHEGAGEMPLELGHFPELWMGADVGALALVLPTGATIEDVSQALEIIRTLSPGAEVPPLLVRAEHLNVHERALHLLLLGEKQRQPTLSELRPFLSTSLDGGSVQVNSRATLMIPDNEEHLGVIQLARSPWQDERAIIAVSGTSVYGYERALEAFLDPSLRDRLSGQVAVVWGARGAIHLTNWHVGDVGAVPILGHADRAVRAWFGRHTLVPLLLAPVLTLLTVAALATLWTRWHHHRVSTSKGGH